jgi:hypothetical protein
MGDEPSERVRQAEQEESCQERSEVHPCPARVLELFLCSFVGRLDQHNALFGFFTFGDPGIANMLCIVVLTVDRRLRLVDLVGLLVELLLGHQQALLKLLGARLAQGVIRACLCQLRPSVRDLRLLRFGCRTFRCRWARLDERPGGRLRRAASAATATVVAVVRL